MTAPSPEPSSASIIWDWLDHAGIDFRAPQRDLIAKGTVRPSAYFVTGNDCVVAPGRQLLKRVRGDVTFHIQEGEALRGEVVRRFEAYVMRASAARDAVNVAGDVSAIFGPPANSNADDPGNTFFTWALGHGRITVSLRARRAAYKKWLRDSYVRSDRERDEAHLSIDPGWLAPLPDRWRGQLADPVRVHQSAYMARPLYRGGPFVYYAKGLANALRGYLVASRDGALIARVDAAQDCASVLPAAWASGVVHTVVKPAKGPGSQHVHVAFQPPSASRGHRFDIDSSEYNATTIAPIAAHLSNALGLPIRHEAYYDA